MHFPASIDARVNKVLDALRIQLTPLSKDKPREVLFSTKLMGTIGEQEGAYLKRNYVEKSCDILKMGLTVTGTLALILAIFLIMSPRTGTLAVSVSSTKCSGSWVEWRKMLSAQPWNTIMSQFLLNICHTRSGMVSDQNLT